MTRTDLILQAFRFRKALREVAPQSSLLDIGCHQGEMLLKHHHLLTYGVGIDPECTAVSPFEHIRLIGGSFPEAAADLPGFDTITALAFVEHLPDDASHAFFRRCFELLHPGGRLICTIPHPRVDVIIRVLQALKLVHTMHFDQHHGYDVQKTIPLAASAGFMLKKHERFQLGLNNLFVFVKPAA